MGQKCCTTKCDGNINENEENISKINFIKKYPIGKGGYGRVNHKLLILIKFNIGLESTIQAK